MKDLVKSIDRLMIRWNRPRRVIVGCEQYDSGKENYLYRYYLLGGTEEQRKKRKWDVYLHVFLRSDEGRDLHDHPWPFVAIMLWKGYIERTYQKDSEYLNEDREIFHFGVLDSRRKYPGMILFRPATWAHRVDLVEEQPAVSLVFRGPECRSWGFWTKNGWTFWKNFFKEKNCYSDKEEE